MNLPWRNLAICDAHVHFFSHRFFQSLEEQKGVPIADEIAKLGMQLPDRDPAVLAAAWASELDTHHVQSAALIASIPGDESSVIAAIQAFPDRFYGYFLFDPTQPDAAGRAAASFDSGMRGICFFPGMHRYSMHDECVFSVLDSLSQRKGIVVFVHCGVLSVGIRGKLGLPSRFDLRFSNPADLHAIALRYPELVFVVPHFGAGYFREMLMVADLCPNVYIDTSSSNSWTRYQVPNMDLREVFRQALDVAGARRLLFGTDSSFFPRGWCVERFEAQMSVLFDLGISTSDAALIFGANLQRILQPD